MGDFDPAVLLDSEMRRLSAKPNMTAKDCRLVMAYGAAIEALRTTPQPVTPAGGEVCDACEGSGYTVRPSGSSTCWKCATHPPAADAALVRAPEYGRSPAHDAMTDAMVLRAAKGYWSTDTFPVGAEPWLERRHLERMRYAIDAALNQRGGG